MKAAFYVWIIALTALPLGAAEIAVIPGEIAIPPEESRSLEFGTVPQRDTTVLLEITARIHTETLLGSTGLLKIVLNGHEVKAARSRGVIRLVNKPLISLITPTLSGAWFDMNGRWRVIYAPDFKAGREVPFYKGDPYTLVLDVTDLTNPAGENRLSLTNFVNRSSLGLKPTQGNMVVQRLTIRTKPGESPTMRAAPNMAPIINPGLPAAGPAKYSGQLTPGGGFVITIGQRQWKFDSAFSYPNAGLNRLRPSADPNTSGQAGWSARVQSRDDGGEVLAEGPDYRLRRSVRFTPRKVEIADELTNVHRDSPLGLLVRHEVSLKGFQLPIVRLAGNPDPALNEYFSPPNPSVHISLPEQSVGLLCEDDVFRNQATLFCVEAYPAAGIRTEMLRLSPGETYTVRWSVYPVAGPDYFDFVNLVRQDWGSNFTVEGAWTLFHPDWILSQPVENLRSHFNRQGIRYAISTGPWHDLKRDPKRIAFGTGALDDYWADYCRRCREAAERIREAAPQVKVLKYYDSQRDTSEGGQERFRDSWLTDREGNQLSTDWGGHNNTCYSNVPTLKNSYGRAMLAAVDRYMDDTHSDGPYWDEMEGVCYGVPPITYNQFDGHSCLLDPKQYTIEREIGIITLLCESQLLAVIDRVRKRGGTLMGNGPPFTRALLATGVPRMVETQHNDYWCYEGNFGTPLGWTDARSDFGTITRILRMACLPLGTNLEAAHEISRWLFPFTPIELYPGYLLGEERIIVLHDGNYGWPGKRPLVQLRHYNHDGKLVEDDSPTLIGTESRTAVKLADEEAIVLVRLPLRFEPQEQTLAAERSAWNAEVRQMRYNPDAISLELRAPQGGVLTIDSGEFPLQDGTAVTVRLGDKSQSIKVVSRALRIAVPAGFSGVIGIEKK